MDKNDLEDETYINVIPKDGLRECMLVFRDKKGHLPWYTSPGYYLLTSFFGFGSV
jgi:hypothetical protein